MLGFDKINFRVYHFTHRINIFFHREDSQDDYIGFC